VDSVAWSGHILIALLQFDAITQWQFIDNLWTVWHAVVMFWLHCFSLMPLHIDSLLIICGQCGRKWSHSVALLQFDASTRWQLIDSLWTVWHKVDTFWLDCFSLMPLHSDNLLIICGQCGRKWSHSVALHQFPQMHCTRCDAVLHTCVICSVNLHRFNGAHCDQQCDCMFDNVKCSV
jgi:hypothetical protein